MSATGRSDERRESDFYKTPEWVIEEFLREVRKDIPDFIPEYGLILDPCAGGDANTRMPYPAVLQEKCDIIPETFDIRDDSPARGHFDFLKCPPLNPCGLVISNPPYSLAVEFVKKALEITTPGGYVAFLL